MVMEFNQLYQFKVIAECETLTQAATLLHISQPALSTMLRKLESELGVQLFERKRNRISLNSAGELALIHANLILDRVEQMKRELSYLDPKGNTVDVCFCDPGPMWFFIPKFSIAYPQIELKTSLFNEDENTIQLLLNGTHDILITAEPIKHSEIVSIPFIKDQLLLSVSENSPLAKLEEITLKEYCPEEINNIYIFHVGGDFFEKKQKPFWKQVKPQIQFTLYDDYFLFNQVIRSTEAITTSTKLVRHYRDDGSGRVLIPLRDKELEIHYHLCYLKKNKKRLNSFISWVEYCVKEYENK